MFLYIDHSHMVYLYIFLRNIENGHITLSYVILETDISLYLRNIEGGHITLSYVILKTDVSLYRT